MSMKSPSSVHSAMSSARSSTSRRDRPEARPPSTMFSRPESALLKPTPSASSVLALPHTSTLPDVGGRIPAIARIRVDLPAPLDPMMPIEVPTRTSKVTFVSAWTSRTARSPRPRRTMACLRVGLRSNVVRYVIERSSTRTAKEEVSVSVSASGETDSKITLPRDEEDEPDGGHRHGPQARADEEPGVRDLRLLDALCVPAQHRVHRVEL